MKVKFQGNEISLEGREIKVGDTAPDFVATDNGLNAVNSKDFTGKRAYVSVPSIDTPVCDLEVRKFNEEAAKLNDVKIYVLSMDLPFAQGRWCGNEGINAVQTLSDYKDRSFGKEFGTYIKELGLLTRAVFVVDENNKITHVEYCEEVTSEPNYEAALNSLK
ncbi:thiol peroxidase [Clostridium chromiireducens]|uniref:Thiol peroxidase n=1 Tax=Clostridium chromiireducens TaxID=225345 RepID=A0A399ILI0_9CLOT|nr:thiol peroxidase [Clostridium chromiireducens]RII33139.1 thiol peroxidase [Clostridium chromiireducens]